MEDSGELIASSFNTNSSSSLNDTLEESLIIKPPSKHSKQRRAVIESDESETELDSAVLDTTGSSEERNDSDTKRKTRKQIIESDESDSEYERAAIETSDSEESGTEAVLGAIQTTDSDDERKDQVASDVKRRSSKSRRADESIEQIESEAKGEKEQQRTSDRYSCKWSSGDLLSSTKLYSSEKSFSTPRETKVIESDDEDIIEVSSDEEATTLVKSKANTTIRQTTLLNFVQQEPPKDQQKPSQKDPSLIQVTQAEYDKEKQKIAQLEFELGKADNLLRTINLAGLPDKGALLMQRHTSLANALKEHTANFQKLSVLPGSSSTATDKVYSTWDDLKKATEAVRPRTQGERALATLDAQKALTMDRLAQLHASLEKRPEETALADDPKGLKVQLMPHQKRALTWLQFRETQSPAGGILADDMGLGKTLTMISLVLKVKEMGEEEEEEEKVDPRSGKYRGGTLVVCPASLLQQWESEVERRTRRGLLDVELYHGAKREKKAKRLAKHDLVVTTYAIIQSENERQGAVFDVLWSRIILDEAHQIRNYKSRTALAVCRLSAKVRWALTGTPVHNKEEDMYGLLKFLRCTPFDDLSVWKRWIANKNSGGQDRLNVVISSLMLRRTKADLQSAGALTCLPERRHELITVKMDKEEMDVYHKVLVFSRTLFAQFLHQHAEKRQDNYEPDAFASIKGNAEYYKMHEKLKRLHRVKEVKQHEILVLLLRLRQICCHPSLITGMLDDEHLNDADDEEVQGHEELNILDQLSKLNLEDEGGDVAQGLSDEAVGLAEATRGILNPSHPVFAVDRRSSKINFVLQTLKEHALKDNDKAIIVSQWASLLRLIAIQLKAEGIVYNELNGSIPVHKRMALVDDFNNPQSKVRVMLLSLTAGGVGLNLVGGNHLLLVDLHWNPQLEMQAQDRIYRVGQTKTVHVYKFMTPETIEERIKILQDRKLAIADSMLTGSKVKSSKLTLSDLKLLFNM